MTYYHLIRTADRKSSVVRTEAGRAIEFTDETVAFAVAADLNRALSSFGLSYCVVDLVDVG